MPIPHSRRENPAHRNQEESRLAGKGLTNAYELLKGKAPGRYGLHDGTYEVKSNGDIVKVGN